MSNISDILSSASLILAALTTIYSLFYPEIRSVLDMVPQTGVTVKDNAPNYNKAIVIRNSKVLPLLTGSTVLSLVFIPEFIVQVDNCVEVFKKEGMRSSSYNTANATYIVVTLFAIMLTSSIVSLSFKFFKQLKKLRAE